jgi:hypothetical protein
VSFCAFGCFECFVVLLLVLDLDIGFVGAHDVGDADAGHHQVVQGQPSTGVVDGDEEQIIQCLKHMRARLVLFILPVCSLYGIVT